MSLSHKRAYGTWNQCCICVKMFEIVNASMIVSQMKKENQELSLKSDFCRKFRSGTEFRIYNFLPVEKWGKGSVGRDGLLIE